MKRFSIAGFLLLFVISCSNSDSTGQSGPINISAADADSLLHDTSVITIDVRSAEEVAGGYISGADLFIDVNSPDFQNQLAALDPNKTYLVYCHSGTRSKKAATIMSNAGFTKVYNMTSGISTWPGRIER